MNKTTYRPRFRYPNVLEALDDGWAVLFIETKHPYRVAEYRDVNLAAFHADGLNEAYWINHHSQVQARLAIARASETSAVQHALSSRASLWSRVKSALHLH